jgi:hypothetical protein
MVCRASAGACAPTVGARLQVRSGLTGESIARRQLLRCDNAETDPRVNLETCRALGIASIVVLPLLRRTGEVRGLFELFSDHPYAFEERDLVALERMAALTLTALDLAEQGHDSVAPTGSPARQTKQAGTASGLSAGPLAGGTRIAGTKHSPTEIPSTPPSPPVNHSDLRVAPPDAESAHVPAPLKSTDPAEPPAVRPAAAAEPSTPVSPPLATSTWSFSAPVISPPVISPQIPSTPAISMPIMSELVIETSPPDPAPVPEAMRRIQKCASCGFPVSEGRTLCLDCESSERLKLESDKKAREKAAREAREIEATVFQNKGAGPTEQQQKEDDTTSSEIQDKDDAVSLSAAKAQGEILPPFLTNPQLVEESWLARHVNLLAFLVLIAAVLVAAVVFFR